MPRSRLRVFVDSDCDNPAGPGSPPFELGDDPGIYVGTSTGQLFASFDDGDSWELLWDMQHLRTSF